MQSKKLFLEECYISADQTSSLRVQRKIHWKRLYMRMLCNFSNVIPETTYCEIEW